MTLTKSSWLRLGLFAVLGLMLIYTLWMQVPRRSGPRNGSLVGAMAPDFRLPALGSPGEIALADLRGKGVVLVFWATTCKSCKKELPLIEQLKREAPDDKVVFLTLAAENPDDLAAFVRQKQMELPVLIDDGRIEGAYAVDTIPYTVFIAPDGTVAADYVGPVPLDILQREVAKLRRPVGG